ncbi:MAG: Holliday junction branch migration DNA helicase RuvB [Patescibacteria group bacterium]|nr:Holliday junction branch migration DNA helicase RuvB [Patescibacteria group bacterium]MDE2438471.1 Holliday junction branch migration DNA helicase RuvB [Patescibacteria group bacterium]
MSTTSSDNREEVSIDLTLRPSNWQEYIGQDKTKQGLHILIEAAKKRKETVDHVLLYGPAGLGKTTLASLIAKEMRANLRITSGPAIEKAGDLASILSNLEHGDVLFIDEAHRINRSIEEVLYPAMESRKLHLIIGKGPAARNFELDLPPFTLVAATTRVALLSNPLRSRFGAIFKLDFYTEDHIKKILSRSADLLRVRVDAEALALLAHASRATPRVANRLLKRTRDLAEVQEKPVITKEVANSTLAMLEVDQYGIEPQERKILETLVTKFKGGPVGLKALAASTNEEIDTIEEVYEPYLIRLGLLERTGKGRIATLHAYQYLKNEFHDLHPFLG